MKFRSPKLAITQVFILPFLLNLLVSQQLDLKTENSIADDAAAPSTQNIISPKRLRYTRVTALDKTYPQRYRDAFDRFVQIVAPNGKPIYIFAQPEISDIQIRHVRNVLLHYLTDSKASRFGSDKTAIANQMANNQAMMMICKGSDGEFREPRIHAQPLYQNETVVEGSAAYMENDFENHRDATLEETLHCVHDFGIGVDHREGMPGAAPEYQKQIRAATSHAMRAGIWPTRESRRETRAWIEELKEEGSLTQEYLASVIDSYYGLWGPFDQDFGMWGIYIAKDRQDIQIKDTLGLKLVEQFFHPYLTYTAEIDPEFTGTFSLNFDVAQPYTHKSRYLLNAQLTGDNHSNLTGNDQANTLIGNAGNNNLNGGPGHDTVIFPKPRSSYQIKENVDGSITVTGDGEDQLISIESLVFDGAELDSRKFVEPVPNQLR